MYDEAYMLMEASAANKLRMSTANALDVNMQHGQLRAKTQLDSDTVYALQHCIGSSLQRPILCCPNVIGKKVVITPGPESVWLSTHCES